MTTDCVVPFSGSFLPTGDGEEPRLQLCRDDSVNANAIARSRSAALFGELYNVDALQRELGLSLATSVEQVLLEGWRRWSIGLLAKLDGVFSLVLHDGQELVLFRDPSGLRNLFFSRGSDGSVRFASHLDQLLSLDGVERRIARHSLHEYLRFLDIAAPHALYENVSAVEPGQAVRWAQDGTEARTTIEPGEVPACPGNFDAAVDALDEYLSKAIRARLADARRPATFLSSGVDSALMCAIASRQRPDLTAFTVGFDDAGFDEAPTARRIAAHLGVTHRVLNFSREQYLGAFDRLAQDCEQPVPDPASLATLLSLQHCKEQHDMVLDGTGADESVGTMPARHVRVAVGHASLIPRRMRTAMARMLRAVPRASRYASILDFEHPADTMIRWSGFTRAEIERLCGEPVSFEHTQFYRTFQRYPRHAHYERYSALVNAMTNERLTQGMLISGTRVRYPYFAPVAERFIRQLRSDYRYLPGQPKRILRALLARYVPREIWDTPKHYFSFPVHDFLAADDHLLVRRHLDVDRWRSFGLLAPEAVQCYARQFIAGDRRLTFRVWALAVLGAWLGRHVPAR